MGDVRRIEVPTDTPTESELGDTAADIQRRRDKSGRRERGKRQRKNRVRRGRRPGGRKHHSMQRRQWQKKVQELRGVKVKWIQRLEEKVTHVKHTPGVRKDT